MMVTRTSFVSTPDGRELCVESGGDPAGPVVLVHGGTPNSRHLATPWLSDAETRGIHLVSYDRPGYGDSTPRPGRTVADCAADVRAIAAALGTDHLASWGISGGGPHVLACAALLPDLVYAAAALASLAPYGAPDLDYFAGMGQDNVDDIKLFLDDPKAAREKATRDRDVYLSLTPDLLEMGLASLLSPEDAAVLNPGVASFLIDSAKDGLAPGVDGWWDDQAAHVGHWGFDVATIGIPVQLWHGAADKFVPFPHGQWLAGHIPGVEAHLTDTDGHLTLFARVPEVHEWLLGHS